MKEQYSIKEFIRNFHADAVEAVMEELLACTVWQVKAEPVIIDDEILIRADLSDDEVEYGKAVQWAIPMEGNYIGTYYTVDYHGFSENDRFDTLDEAEEAFQEALFEEAQRREAQRRDEYFINRWVG